MSLALALLLQTAPAATPPAAPEPCDKPVYMVVEGRTIDRARMMAYGKALAQSEIYQRLGGYYITLPQPVAVFEGDVPKDYVNLTVRFPCLANARAFWNSRVYQETILPLRQNPSAGDYTVTVYAEAPLRADMIGRVEAGRFLADFSQAREPQVEPKP
jgi:uncharacterized protein (DUF1330 family)